MARRWRAKPGDVLRIPLPDGRYGYIHYVMFDEEIYNCGPLVVALDLITTEPLDDAAQLVGFEKLFGPVWVGVWAGQKLEGWSIIGQLPVRPFEMPSFRSNLPDLRPGKKYHWRLHTPQGEVFLGELPEEYRSLGLMSGESIWSLADRIATGKAKKDLLY